MRIGKSIRLSPNRNERRTLSPTQVNSPASCRLQKQFCGRTGQGQSFIELTIGIVILVPVLLVLFDLSMMIMKVEANDSNCRKAARAAASGPPAEATARAQSVINSLQTTSKTLASSYLVSPVSVQIVSQPEEERDIAAGKQTFPGGAIIGSTTVTTEIEVSPIIIHNLYGGKSPMRFQSTHSFPISYVIASH